MRIFTGTIASSGLAVGPVVRIDHGMVGLHRIVSDPHRERALYDAAIVLAKDELMTLQKHAQDQNDADILMFQVALLEDESFTNEIGDYIAAGAGSAAAVERAERIFADRIRNIDDDYLRERSVDVCDACRRVVDILDGRAHMPVQIKTPSILVSDLFYPSDLFALDRSMVLGLVSEKDSVTSHAAIMARSMGIPALCRVGEGTAVAADGVEALSLFQTQPFDLVLLDVMLPKIDGFGVCEMIRRQSQVPVLMLTALDGEADQLRGFGLDIDDYVTKPFSMPVLLEKIRVILRRSGGSEQADCLRYRDLLVNPDTREALLNGRPLDLTAREFELLQLLLASPGRVFTREMLLLRIWGYDSYVDERVVDSHIKNLRHKLQRNYIETVRGVGYRAAKETG